MHSDSRRSKWIVLSRRVSEGHSKAPSLEPAYRASMPTNALAANQSTDWRARGFIGQGDDQSVGACL